jgi:hypothetical protein
MKKLAIEPAVYGWICVCILWIKSELHQHDRRETT